MSQFIEEKYFMEALKRIQSELMQNPGTADQKKLHCNLL